LQIDEIKFHFSDHSVSKSSIETVLEAGVRVSIKNETDRWSFVVIQDESYVRYLREYGDLLNILDGKDGGFQDITLNSNG